MFNFLLDLRHFVSHNALLKRKTSLQSMLGRLAKMAAMAANE